MKRLMTILALAGLTTACDDRNTAATVSGPETMEVSVSRGAIVARDVCAGCHGADLGGSTVQDVECPSLEVIRDYSLNEFNALLRDGIGRHGARVNSIMKVTRTLTAGERAALHDYLNSLGG